MRQADLRILKKIMGYCDDISGIVRRFGDDEALYRSDRVYQYATSMCILQIGELTARLSDDTKEQLPEIPWRMIRGMRNIYAHNYEKAEPRIMWQTITEDIPTLRVQLARALETLSPAQPDQTL